MPCFVMRDMTGSSKRVQDKEVLEYLEEMRAFGEDWEVEEYRQFRPRWFREPIEYRPPIYGIYIQNPGGWQVIQAVSTKREFICFALGYINGWNESKRRKRKR